MNARGVSAREQVRAAIAEYGRPAWVAAVPFRVIKEVPYHEVVEMLESARASQPSSEKHQRVASYERWLELNAGEEVTIVDVCDRLGISVGHARRFVADRPHLLWKVRRGVWVARDPHADREAGA
jgi:hypothetical protein